ncbi:ribokinase [Panacibacter ginsenosidivorans]|uniref:Ribokinase n=1 Tax=Panacibacter ginsenosidivorans TaxID=1813871 RepID=A0A5B8V7I9_9BACT|nr:ribokinase [Panacibacter ginsenosidivorans]QEC66656.1 ribokinase [Panacibacter ginsenosidivorans]
MKKPSIIIVGSSNTDMVIKSPYLAKPGETILGGTFFMNAGGKGANQAVAAARLGGNISLIAKVGNDIFGKQAIELFKKEGIDTTHVFTDKKHPSGVALINVDDNGENCIVVASGANAALIKEDIESAKDKIANASIVLMQLETPVSTIEHVASFAKVNGVKVVLNPAPAAELSDELLQNINIITPNQHEAGMLTNTVVDDVDAAKHAARILNGKGVETVIITLGANGALLYEKDFFTEIAAPVVKAVDTTAAGDIFNGALVVALSEGKTMKHAVEYACNAAAISVTRLGAQASAPYRNEVADAPALKEEESIDDEI